MIENDAMGVSILISKIEIADQNNKKFQKYRKISYNVKRVHSPRICKITKYLYLRLYLYLSVIHLSPTYLSISTRFKSHEEVADRTES